MFSLTNASLLLVYPFSLHNFLRAAVIYTTGTLVSLYLVFHPRNQWLVDNRSRVQSGLPSVALTFDDGPDPVSTPLLLDLLRKKGVPATFFVVGERVAQYPDVVRRAYAEGHLIENHTWSHPSVFCFLMPSRLSAEIDRCRAVIEDICGHRPRYFRSPVGLRHPLLRPYLKSRSLEYISWQIRTCDTLGLKSPELVDRILTRVTAGDIILLHDHQANGVDVMLEALPQVIDELRRRGFDFVLVGPNSSVERAREATVQ
jgi:peptidoglycan/xylan/chitin deacetylase (PgdA/CDA1 family)